MLRGPRAERASERTPRPIVRDLCVVDPAGHQRYLGRPLYFGPFQPDARGEFEHARQALVNAENGGRHLLDEALAVLGLCSLESWWHIEASFYQHEVIGRGTPRPSRSEAAMPLPRARVTPHGTPAPELLSPTKATRRLGAGTQPPAQDDDEPPVPFEVFCEIAGAQAAWSSLGLDPTNEASRYFLLEPAELLGVELYWAAELAKSRELARQFARRMLEYKESFSGG